MPGGQSASVLGASLEVFERSTATSISAFDLEAGALGCFGGAAEVDDEDCFGGVRVRSGFRSTGKGL